jgi:photosystem II stability/assembly factor-like uncharacterized protein
MLFKRASIAVLLAAACAAPASANVQVGSSGWQWGNPLPQGNTLRAMSFAGQAGYAAGDFGTLLKTTDGGATWTGLPVGTFQGLTVVQALGAETVVAGGGCVARRSTDGGATFSSIAFSPVEVGCSVGLRDLSFVSADRGFLLLADGSLFTTTDGGTQFAPRTAVPGTAAAGAGFGVDATSIAFLDATTGYAATTAGKLFQTLDGGVSWKVVAESLPSIRRVWFLDATRGFAVGDAGLLLRTVDGGGTWERRELGAAADYASIHCASAQLCLLTTATGAQLVRTADAGTTPGTVITPSNDPIYAAAFASPTRVSAVGANGTTVRSDDAGATFAPVGGRLAGSYAAIRAGGERGTAFAPGRGGALAKTGDGGASWTRSDVPTTSDLLDVSFPTASVGYALDLAGGVFRTANAGETWKTLGTGSARRAYALHAPSPDVVVLIGLVGVRRSTDGGETFAQVRGRAVTGAQLYGVAPAGGETLFAWGRKRVVRSVDGGRTWSVVPRPASGMGVARVAFSSARAGLLQDVKGRIWRTRSAGRRWRLVRTVGTEAIAGMAVSSAREAYLVLPRFGIQDGGYLLRTNDGGRTWQPQFVVSSFIRGLAAPRGGTDYLLGGDAAFLATSTGGSAGERSFISIRTKRRRLPKPRAITVTGRLQPASGGGQVVVSALAPGARRWTHQMVRVASNGTFASRWQVRRGTTTFVAQWAGDFSSAGAGSIALDVNVGRR